MQSPEAGKVGVCPRGPARVADRCCRLCRMNFKCVSLVAGTLIEKNAPTPHSWGPTAGERSVSEGNAEKGGRSSRKQ